VLSNAGDHLHIDEPNAAVSALDVRQNVKTS